MKTISILTFTIILLMSLAGCGATEGVAPAESPQNSQTVTAAPTDEVSPQPSGELPTDIDEEPTDDQSGGDDVDIPEVTPWPEPASVDYQGSYMDIAQDKDASRYPSLKVSQEVETCYGMMKIPSKWKIDDPYGVPTLKDDKGRIVGLIYQKEAYISEPYFALMPDKGTPMAWEATDKYMLDARALTLESDATSSDEKKKTVVKIVSLLMDEPFANEDGTEYYLAFCLSFDKAYIDGGNADYVVSNKTIDEIVSSFADGLNLE